LAAATNDQDVRTPGTTGAQQPTNLRPAVYEKAEPFGTEFRRLPGWLMGRPLI
jgi:hypothetical protein